MQLAIKETSFPICPLSDEGRGGELIEQEQYQLKIPLCSKEESTVLTKWMLSNI